MKKINHLTSEKGMALIWSLVTISILLIISTSMGQMVAKDIRMTGDMVSSQKAYSAAESGFRAAELKKTEADTGDYSQSDILVDSGDPTGPTFSYKIHKDGNNYNIESTGKADTITRKIERTITELGTAGTQVINYTDPAHAASTINVVGVGYFEELPTPISPANFSVEYQFKVINPGNSFSIGFGDDTTEETRLFVVMQKSVANNTLKLTAGSTELKSVDATPLVSGSSYKLKIDYHENANIKVSLNVLDSITGNYNCLSTFSATNTNVMSSNIDWLYYSVASWVSPGPLKMSAPDGLNIEVNNVYFVSG